MRIATKTALAFALFAVVCVIGSGALLIDEFRQALGEAELERPRLLASNRALVLRENLALATGELERLAAMSEIDLSDDDPRPERRLLTQAYRQTTFFNARLELFDVEGRCRWAEPAPTPCEGQPATRAPWLQAALRSPEETHLSIGGEEPERVALVAPVRRGGALVGLLRGVVDLHDDLLFSPALHDELAASTQVALIAGDGADLIPREPRALAGPGRSAALAGLAAGRAGAVVVRGAGGERVTAWAPVGRAGLGVAFSWPRAALDDAGERHVRSLTVSIGVVALLALLTGFVVARVLTRPLQRLATQVRGIGESGLRSLPPSLARDEIGDVSRALRGLLAELDAREREVRDDRDRIAELASELESRVEARTLELREAQGALVRAERMAAIGRAGTVISHELRNSLNAVSMAMDTLGRDVDDDAQHVTRRLVRGEIARLRRLSDEMIRYAREPVVEREEVSLADVITTAALLVEDHARASGVEVEVVADEAPTAHADPDLLQTVVVNVLRNAIDAAAGSDGARSRICARAAPEGAEVVVEDSGAGVDPSIRDEVLQAFVTTRRQGLGLGLAIADRFIQAHGGRIDLDRSDLGGARFTVHLPSGREQAT